MKLTFHPNCMENKSRGKIRINHSFYESEGAYRQKNQKYFDTKVFYRKRDPKPSKRNDVKEPESNRRCGVRLCSVHLCTGLGGYHAEATSFCNNPRWQKHFARKGLARILRSANFRIVASISCANDLPPSRPQLHQPLFLIAHTGDNFDAAIEQIGIIRDRHPTARIAIVADRYRLSELVSALRAGARLLRRRHDVRCIHQIHRTGDDG